MRANRRVREQAAEILSAAASNCYAPCESMQPGHSCLACVSHPMGYDPKTYRLAHAAWIVAGFNYAEAECRLRTRGS